MSKVIFVQHEGETREIEASEGSSAMRAALTNGVAGIDADCGGEAACATCHVYVAEEWHAKVGTPGLDEEDMLEFTACERKGTSRLSCQILIDEDLDGLVLNLPESQ